MHRGRPGHGVFRQPGAGDREHYLQLGGSEGSIEFSGRYHAWPRPLALTIDANGKQWATKPEGGATAILIAQAFSDDEGMKIDITDDNAERIIAKLRVSRAHDEGSEPVIAGTLLIVGAGAWPVTCEGE